jgi:hypothetical protein
MTAAITIRSAICRRCCHSAWRPPSFAARHCRAAARRAADILRARRYYAIIIIIAATPPDYYAPPRRLMTFSFFIIIHYYYRLFHCHDPPPLFSLNDGLHHAISPGLYTPLHYYYYFSG